MDADRLLQGYNTLDEGPIPGANSEEDVIEGKETSFIIPGKRIKSRKQHLRGPGRPLIWQHTIEEYWDEGAELNDAAVLRIFSDLVEGAPVPYLKSYDQYYNCLFDHPPRRARVGEDELMEESRKLIETQLVTVRDRLRSRAREERYYLNASRRLHVRIKQAGYDTEGTLIFSLMAREIVLQKKQLIREMEAVTNKLTALYSEVLVDARYVQKCAEFLERKIPIRHT